MAGGVKAWDTGSAGPLRDAKGTTYEGGVRVPGIFRWPGRIPPGRTSAEIATTMDLFPTLLNAAGAEIPALVTDAATYDLRGITRDIDGGFLARGGLDEVRAAADAGSLPVLDGAADLRVGAPIARPRG